MTALPATSTNHITAAGRTVSLTELGDERAPVYLLVHGIGASSRYYRPLAAELSHGGRVLVPDLPGFGRSPRTDTPLSIPLLAEALADLLHGRAPGQPVVVVGHSMGAQVATELAASNPELVSQLVLLGPVVNPAERHPVRQAARLAQDFRHEPWRVNALLAADYQRCGFRWYSGTLTQMFAYEIEHRLPDVVAPVTVARGDRDPVASREWIETLAATATRGRAVEIAGGGHVMMYPRAAEVAAQCRVLQ